MSNLRDYLTKINPAQPNLDAPWVTVGHRKVEHPTNPAYYWRCVLIHHLTPDENHGQHNVFVDCVDENGRLEPPDKIDQEIGWTWEGRDESTEPAPFYQLDKKSPSPYGDMPLFINMNTTVWIEDTVDSDTVEGLRLSGYPPLDGDGGNYPGHNSYYIVWMLAKYATTQPVTPPVITEPPTVPEIPTSGTWQEAVAELAHRVKLIEDVINAKG